MRLALGAGRGRIVRHLLLEGLMLSAVGGLVGRAAAMVRVTVLLRRDLLQMPRIEPLDMTDIVDIRLLGFAWAAVLAVGLAAGVGPAIKTAWRETAPRMPQRCCPTPSARPRSSTGPSASASSGRCVISSCR